MRRWAIFVMGSLNFVLSMFYRVSSAVISPTLISELGFTSVQLSDLAAVFFYAFALSQVPIGLAMDRVGPRATMGFLALPAIAGVLLFASGRTPTELTLARALLGIGMSGNLMVVLALLAVWFPVDRFAFLSGIVVAVGVVGNLLAATPLALMTMHLGWRTSFLVFAAANAVIVAIFLLVARDHPPGHKPFSGKPPSLFTGLGRLLGMYSYWAISLASFSRYGYFAALQSLWLGPFFIYGMGLGEIAASNALLAMGVGYMIGLPVSGFTSDRLLKSRKQVVLAALGLFCLFTILFSVWTPSPEPWCIYPLFLCMGFVAAPGQILYAHIKELLPPPMIAQAMTAVNLFTVLGAGVMTQLLGLVLSGEPSCLVGPDGFRPLWIVGALVLGGSFIAYAFVPDSRALREGDS